MLCSVAAVQCTVIPSLEWNTCIISQKPRMQQVTSVVANNQTSADVCKLIPSGATPWTALSQTLYSPLSEDTVPRCRLNYKQLECGPMPNVMVALLNIGGALCSTPQSLADTHYKMLCSNAAKTRNQLKFSGVPQTPEPISAVSEPKFTI